MGPTEPYNAQRLLIILTRQPKVVLLRSADARLSILYNRETNEFFSVAPEKQSDASIGKGDEEQGSLLKEASRLAHSVRVVYLCDTYCTDRSPQVFDDMTDDDIRTNRSPPAAAQDPHTSASTARSKPNRERAQSHTVSEAPPKDETTSENPSTGDDDTAMPDDKTDHDTAMPDDPREGNGGDYLDAATQREGDGPPAGNEGSSLGAASRREDGEVRVPGDVFHGF